MSSAHSDLAAPKVKICGLTRVEDAEAAAHAGADVLGTILSTGFGRSVDPDFARRIGEETGRPVVGVTVNETVDRLVEIAEASGVTILQLHGDESPSTVEELRRHGDWTIWKAKRVRSTEEVELAVEEFAGIADGLLLDGWHPEHAGGSGVRFPWDLVAPVRYRIPDGMTFIAAGGLRPENVAEAVGRLDPDVVDVSSGVEMAHGMKDAGRIQAFIRNARSVGAEGSR